MFGDPIRPTREHIAISPRSGLYAMPSLCGSAGASRGWFRAFTEHSFLACRSLSLRGARSSLLQTYHASRRRGRWLAAHCARAAASDAGGWISRHRKVLAERGPPRLCATPHRRDLYHNGERTQSVPPLSAASRAARAIAIFCDADHTMSCVPVTAITVPALVF